MKPFYHLSTPLTNIEGIRDFIRESEKSQWKEIASFAALPLPLSLLSGDDELLQMISKFDGRVGVLRLAPMRFYPLHTDLVRKCCINVLINNTRSTTMFKVREVTDHMFDIVELQYEVGRPVLFNTQVPHAVTNFEGTRDVLSIGLFSVDFNTAYRYCIEKSI